MPKKKSIKRSARDFQGRADAISGFVTRAKAALPVGDQGWVHDYAIISLYREFESLVLETLVGAINNDTNTISQRLGFKFPRHMSDEVCQYLIVGDGYFDFKGRDGLIKVIKQFVPDPHFLLTVVKKKKHNNALERLSALRNFAAHASAQSKKAAKKATSQRRLSTAGNWLKVGNRMADLIDSLKELASEIHSSAPH